MRILQVEGEGGGFGHEGELGGGHGEGGRAVAAEELGLEAVEVGFQVDKLGRAGAAAA